MLPRKMTEKYIHRKIMIRRDMMMKTPGFLEQRPRDSKSTLKILEMIS